MAVPLIFYYIVSIYVNQQSFIISGKLLFWKKDNLRFTKNLSINSITGIVEPEYLQIGETNDPESEINGCYEKITENQMLKFRKISKPEYFLLPAVKDNSKWIISNETSGKLKSALLEQWVLFLDEIYP